MAEVWKAKAQGPAGFEKVVAVKTILPHLLGDLEFIDMFVEEAKLVARLVHPNIVQVFDFGVSDADDARSDRSEYYITMEYVAGQNLATLVSRLRKNEEALSQDVALLIVAETAEALGFAHALDGDTDGKSASIVHRDVSPHNILVSYRGEVKVTDFGIAKVESALPRTGAGVWKGKMAYMSPEQIRIEPLDARSDVFSLGLVLFELVKGQRLFHERTSEELYRQVKSFDGLTDEMLAGIPWAVRDILQTALQLNPDERYQNASEMAQAVSRALGTARTKPAREGLASLMGRLFESELEEENTEDESDPDSRVHRTRSWMQAILDHEDSTAIRTRVSEKEPTDPGVDPVTRISDTVVSGAAPHAGEVGPDNLQIVEEAREIAPVAARAQIEVDDDVDELVEGAFADTDLTPPPKNTTSSLPPIARTPEHVVEEPADEPAPVREPETKRKPKPVVRLSFVVTATVFLLLGLALPRILKYFEEPLDTLGAQLPGWTTPPPDKTVPTPPPQEMAELAVTPATPEATATRTPAPTPEPTKVAVVTPASTPTATPTPILKMALVRDPFSGGPGRDAAAGSPSSTPKRVVVRRTPRPTPRPRNTGSGHLTVLARPWVQVWLDGKKVASETPMRRLQVSAGSHRLRFINPDLKLQLDKTVKVPADGELSLFVDVQKGNVEIR